MASTFKPQILHIRTGVDRPSVARCFTISPQHHILAIGQQLVELVEGEVRRRATGPYLSSVHALPDGRLVLLGLQEMGVWNEDTLRVYPFLHEGERVESANAVSCDGQSILLVGHPPEAGVAMRAGLDGVVVEHLARPGSHVFGDHGVAFFVEATVGSVAVTAWDERGPRSLGQLAATSPPRPWAHTHRGRALVSDSELGLHLFSEGMTRSLGIAAPNPALDTEGFVATAVGSVARARGASGLICRWSYDGTPVWEVPVHATGLRTVRDRNVFAAHQRDQVVLVDALSGEVIGNLTLKLTRTESIETVVATAEGAIVLYRRHGEATKYAHLVRKGEAPVVLKHERVAGAMPFGERMATWAGATDEEGVLTIQVWDVPAPR